MLSTPQLRGISLTLISILFLIGTVFNKDWALWIVTILGDGKPPTGFPRLMWRVLIALGAIVLLVGGITLAFTR